MCAAGECAARVWPVEFMETRSVQRTGGWRVGLRTGNSAGGGTDDFGWMMGGGLAETTS